MRPANRKKTVDGDVIVATLRGALETKVRPAIVVASDAYLVEHPDVIVGILTTRIPATLTSTDYTLLEWRQGCERSLVSAPTS